MSEAQKRGLDTRIVISSDEAGSDENPSVSRSNVDLRKQISTPHKKEAQVRENAQDPDTDVNISDHECSSLINTAIGFLKNYRR